MGSQPRDEWITGTVGEIARKVVPLNPGDSIAHAIELMRTSGLTSYPVVNSGLLIAMATLDNLSHYVSRDWDTGFEQVRLSPILLTLSAGMNFDEHRKAISLRNNLSYAEAIAQFDNAPGQSSLAVVNAAGGYLGVVTLSDLLATRVATLSPPRMGGMATPIGVYLTDGVNAGGAGFFGLMLTGMCLAVLSIFASVIATFLLIAMEKHLAVNPFDVLGHWAYRQHGDDVLVRSELTEIQQYVSLPILLVLLRLIPLAGYHAAEHQVVHCTERGEAMTIPMVRSMPRVHPRCGTNLVAGLSLFGLLMCFNTIVSGGIIGAVLPSALLTLFFWQPVGSFFQQFFTTRPASDKQIRSGIAAAEMLMSTYRSDVSRKTKPWLRIWRMGLLQVLAGVLVVLGIAEAIVHFVPSLNGWL